MKTTVKQLAAAFREIETGVLNQTREGRRGQLMLIADVGAEYGWNDNDMDARGKGREFVTAVLVSASKTGKASPSEISKYADTARPKIRPVIGQLFDRAAAARDADGELWDREATVLSSMLKHFKSPDVSTVEIAFDRALQEKRAKSKAAGTVEAQREQAIKRVRSAVNGLADYYTGESIAALVAAMGGLEIKLPEQAEPEEVEPEQAAPAAFDINAILNSMTVDEKIKAIAALQVTK